MPQLDFSTFFLQFITISSLFILLIWIILVNFFTVVYALIFVRKFVFEFFKSFNNKSIDLLLKDLFLNFIFFIYLNFKMNKKLTYFITNDILNRFSSV